jgi:hypothetical protein
VYKTGFKLLCVPFILCALLVKGTPAQQQSVESREDSAYGTEFFDELRTIFGRFRNSDLQRVFQEAKAIQCSELVSGKGEWRTVAFFNEDRKLGDWYKQSLEEVKSDLADFKFTGSCREETSKLRVATEFPTEGSLEAYNKRQIDFRQIDITVNDPVDVVLNSRTMAYTFDLPYLFLQRGSQHVYSFMAPDRNAYYADDVAGRWECKIAAAKDVTYRFLICHTMIVPRGPAAKNMRWQASFGSAGFFILSDGMKAQASVNILFGDKPSSSRKPLDSEPSQTYPPRPILKRPEP